MTWRSVHPVETQGISVKIDRDDKTQQNMDWHCHQCVLGDIRVWQLERLWRCFLAGDRSVLNRWKGFPNLKSRVGQGCCGSIMTRDLHVCHKSQEICELNLGYLQSCWVPMAIFFQGHGSRAVFCASISPTGEFSYVGTAAKFGLLRLVLSNHFWQLKMEASGLPIANSLLLNWLAQHVIRPLNKAGRSEAWKLVSHTAYWHLVLLHTAYLTCSEDTYLHREYITNLSGSDNFYDLWIVLFVTLHAHFLKNVCWYVSAWPLCDRTNRRAKWWQFLSSPLAAPQKRPLFDPEKLLKTSERALSVCRRFSSQFHVMCPWGMWRRHYKRAVQNDWPYCLSVLSVYLCGGWSVPLLFSWCWKWLRF